MRNLSLKKAAVASRVISQSPKPFTVGLQHGARVSLVISTGKR